MTGLAGLALTRCALALTAASLLAAASRAQQPRDNRRPDLAGAATISGVVIADDAEKRPLRRVRVTVTGAELGFARTAITNDEGAFVFDALPAGRYSLSASKDGYVPMNHGARRPGRPGLTLHLAAAEARRITLPLPKGGVITGTLLTPHGEPAAGVAVIALASRFIPGSGERRLSPATPIPGNTDDRGVYRIFGLAAGSYVISVIPRLPLQAMEDVQVLSEREIRGALAEVREQRVQPRPGMPRPAPPAPHVPGERRSVGLTPIFYPGTAVQSRAVPIVLEPGEVRHGVDFDLEYVTLARVEGLVSMPPGMRVVVTIADAERTGAAQTTRMSATPGGDGTFVFGRVPPGSFTISARAFPAAARSGAIPAQTHLWGETGIVVGGDDIAGISIDLQPAISISGRVEFEGGAPPAPGAMPLRVPLTAIAAGGGVSPPLPSVLFNGTTFSINGVVPGIYTFPSPPRGIRAPIGRWWLKSVVVNGRELLDEGLDLRQSAADGVITFSDRASEVSGVVRAADGTPFTDGFVVVFARHKSAWFHGSRRVAGARPTADGRYVVKNLPPGEYLVAVSEDLEANEWFDPDVLGALAPTASPVSLRDLEIRRHDLELKR
jgi:uncharacterized protein (DUF2141 family)